MSLPSTISELETPAALVDIEQMRANLGRVAEYCRTHGLGWRPHVKTHKTPELAAEQIRAGARGITVATPREAEAMADVANDILLAYPPFGASKLQRLMALPQQVRLTVGLDSREALRTLAQSATQSGREVGVLIELDAGMHRVGVATAEDAVALAREAVALEGIDYRGIMFYPGHIRGRAAEEASALRALSEFVARSVEVLEEADLSPEVVSGGSTPTLWHSHMIAGLTEVRPGTNIFNDRATAGVGACEWEECAYTVLATVVSTAVAGQAVIDAGSKALAKEELRAEGGGYGALLDRPEVVVKGLSEEHGLLDLSRTDWRPQVGDRVRVVPNHVCVSVNLHERLWGVRGDEVVDGWSVAGRGRLAAA
jgi:D-serine deaminase-like pyridoxal phosphate-dependent protein